MEIAAAGKRGPILLEPFSQSTKSGVVAEINNNKKVAAMLRNQLQAGGILVASSLIEGRVYSGYFQGSSGSSFPWKKVIARFASATQGNTTKQRFQSLCSLACLLGCFWKDAFGLGDSVMHIFKTGKLARPIFMHALLDCRRCEAASRAREPQ